jgi:hypothetical protein
MDLYETWYEYHGIIGYSRQIQDGSHKYLLQRQEYHQWHLVSGSEILQTDTPLRNTQLLIFVFFHLYFI